MSGTIWCPVCKATTSIPSDREIWETKKLTDILTELDFQKISEYRTLGMTYLGIGIGMFLSGLMLISPTITKRNI